MLMFWIRAAVVGFVLGHAAQVKAEATNLLQGRAPVASSGVVGGARITDGLAVPEGSFWLTEHSARLRDRDAYVIFDLGGPRRILCAFLQGDNNDTYRVEASINGNNFYPIFIAPPVEGSGMRTRTLKLVATARFVRIQARGGDGSYSVSELGLYDICPDPWPNELERVEGQPINEGFGQLLRWFTGASVLFVLIFLGVRSRAITVLAAAVPLGLAGLVLREAVVLYPIFDQEPAIRGSVALIAAALAVRLYLLTKLPAPNIRLTSAVLTALAVLAVGCYYHFGAAQFWHAKEGRRTYVHSYDMRHYFPVAKYFGELSFDGLYAASFSAYLELNGLPFERLGNFQFRDLRESKMKPAHTMRGHIEEVQSRFSQPRWHTFKADIRTFIDIMGDQAFLNNMNDHGGNATPVWLLAASPILHFMPATELNLVITGLFDPLLLALLFLCIGRTFGWRVLGFVVVLFGATDFYQLGSNFGGSMLRQDWLVALGLGACAFKTSRPVLGGALFAYAGLLRAFPAMATFFFVLPALWWGLDHWRTNKRWPSWQGFLAEHRNTVRAAMGATLCVTLLFGLSLAVFGSRAWAAWGEKISIHNQDVSVNNIGLRNVVAYAPSTTAQKLAATGKPNPWSAWEKHFFENLKQRAPIRYAFLFGYLALAIVATRRRSPQSAGLIGLTTIPVLFYPSNYYLHLIFLLPLAVVEAPTLGKRFGLWVTLLCALCVGQWATYSWAKGWTDEFFNYQSFLLLGTFVAMLAVLAKDALANDSAESTGKKLII